MLNLQKISKRFGSFSAVDGLTINVKAGEFYGFLGPNGAGKTTTIKMITGLFNPTSGSIKVDGYDVAEQPLVAKKRIGYIPDQPFLYEKLTGREFLFFSAGLYKIGHDEAAGEIDNLMKLLEIGSWADQRSENYSQGMRQRIVIAAALIHGPLLLVVDEPMVGLDPRSANIVKNLFRERAKNGAAIFMSTHSLQVAEELCDRVGIIKEGRLIYEGSTTELKATEENKELKFESLFLELTK